MERFFDDAMVTVKLNDVNDPPVINGATILLPENTIDSTVVHSVVASDADLPAAILEYSITGGNDRMAFAIDQEGLITVDSSRILDFETTPDFSLTVRVCDGELFSEAIVTINLVDVNERPTVKSATIGINENLPNGTIVHQVIATDPDANDVLTFSLESGNTDSGFSINENTGELMINNSDSVDFILNPVFKLAIRAQDRAGLAGRALIRVELINIPEKSDFNPLKGFSPDGDGINDFWLIQGIDVFTDNEVKVFNRWGNLVFETSHYDNNLIVWRGESNGKMVLTGQQVIDSTYYYIIRINGLREPITGYVIVKK